MAKRKYRSAEDYPILVASLARTEGVMSVREIMKDLLAAGIGWPDEGDESLERDIRILWEIDYPWERTLAMKAQP